MSEYLKTSEAHDVIGSLEHCLLSVNAAAENTSHWKWVILSLHNALQGTMVCYLNDTSQTGALSDDSKEERLTWHIRDVSGDIVKQKCGEDDFGPIERVKHKKDQMPKPILDKPSKLFSRICKGEHGENPSSRTSPFSKEQIKNFKWLNVWRNEFIHFPPQGLSFGLRDIGLKCLSILTIIESLANDHWPFRHLKDDERDHLFDLINKLKIQFKKPL